jgi:hypothetical protein
MLYRDIGLSAQAPTLAVLAGQKVISRLKHYEAFNDFIKRFFPRVLSDGHILRGHTFLIEALLRHRIPSPKARVRTGNWLAWF